MAVDQTAFLSALEAQVAYAYQPVVSARTGQLYGFEALLRGYESLGMVNARATFEHAYRLGLLGEVEAILRHKAITGFAAFPGARSATLFLNLDGRLGEMDGRMVEAMTSEALRQHDLPQACLCFELSERFDARVSTSTAALIERYHKAGWGFALDDFGEGVAQMRALFEHRIDILKLDRFFVTGLDSDPRKRLFVTAMLRLAHTLGARLVAKGVETRAEFQACREIGCDYVQGLLIAPPTFDITAVPDFSDVPARIARRDLPEDAGQISAIRARMEDLQIIPEATSLSGVVELFRKHPDQAFFPVLDGNARPLGVVREATLKSIVYSPYGRDLIQNKGFGKTLRDHLTRCLVAEISMPLDEVLEIYTASNTEEGVAITEGGRYVGFLRAQALLHLMHQKNLAVAQDQNPLTNLPGNRSIADRLSRWLGDPALAPVSVAYFDFDNFKPFNDTLGFSAGDRAILAFAELMRTRAGGVAAFLGHIGGDDFVAIFTGLPLDEVVRTVRSVTDAFAAEAALLYDEETRERGWIMAKGRDGEMRRTPLLRCSTAIVAASADIRDLESLSRSAAALKARAKKSADGLAFAEAVPA